MFDRVARRYDLTNTVLSAGQDRAWRRATRDALAACGRASGCSTSPPAPRSPRCPWPSAGATAVACDFSLGMLRAGRHRPVPLVAGDALALPFADGAFDAVTISFGLRNVADPDAGAARAGPGHPAGRPAGGLRVQPADLGAVAGVYTEYLMRALPAVARRVSSNPARTSTSPSRSGPGRTRPALAGRIGAAGWPGWAGAT